MWAWANVGVAGNMFKAFPYPHDSACKYTYVIIIIQYIAHHYIYYDILIAYYMYTKLYIMSST
jgi:hypothetical protein